jgi:hypothetical protein
MNSDFDSLSLIANSEADPTITDSATLVTSVWAGPILQLIDPNPAFTGEAVILSGEFGADPGAGNRSTDDYNITVGGLRVPDADVQNWTDTAISVRLPVGATSGLVYVVADGISSNETELVILSEVNGYGEANCNGYIYIEGDRRMRGYLRMTALKDSDGISGTGMFRHYSATSGKVYMDIENIAEMTVSSGGGNCSISGSCKVNGVSGFEFSIELKDSPDAIAIVITGPDAYSFNASESLSGGQINIIAD